MKIDDDTNALLNAVLRIELTAINQYFLHARMFGNWGLEGLNAADYTASIRAMKDADTLIERVLFLEGLPNLQDLGRLRIGENVPEALGADKRLEHELRAELVAAIARLETARDYVSRELLEDILEHCEARIDWLERQEWLIANTGLENYLQSMQEGD